MSRPVRVAILWHMHQPYYRNPFTGRYDLPWLRLHALKDYFGMARLVREFPGLRATFNLVPSMLLQLEGYLGGERDVYQDLFRRPAAELLPEEVQFLVRHFFSVNNDHHIRPHERYHSLYRKKMDRLAGGADPDWRSVFSRDELRDLQVWFQLTYFDEEYKRHDPRVREAIAKGGLFSEEDKLPLAEAELELLAAVVPEYAELWRQGQIEVSTTPFFHPILPLLLDPQAGRQANPHLPEYSLAFSWPDDARWHVDEALAFMERTFGRRPAGIWPAEGSLSPAALDMIAAAGVSWAAADEANLARSLETTFERDGQFRLLQAERLYRPYRWGDGPMRLFFRDHYLSDLIGFYYQKFPAREAAADLVARLKEAGRHGGDDPLVPLILDGENAWEFYPESGRPFLRELYGLLASDPGIRTVTFGECLQEPCPRLDRYIPGSWINANFDIWIGDEEDRRAWALLHDARSELHRRRPELTAENLAECDRLLHAAQGSDWFWWYGKENFTPDIDVFDGLFRQNLQKIYQLLGQPVPESLFIPVHDAGRRGGIAVVPPRDFLQPEIDGVVSDYFEWMGAGRVDINAYGGAANIANPIVRSLHFGFSRTDFFLRIDTKKDAAVYFDNGFSLKVTVRGARRCELAPAGSQPGSAVGAIIELQVPLSEIGSEGGGTIDLSLEWAFNGQPFQSVPADRMLRLAVPGERDYAANWQV